MLNFFQLTYVIGGIIVVAAIAAIKGRDMGSVALTIYGLGFIKVFGIL